MTVGSLVRLIKGRKFLYTSPAVYRADASGLLEEGDVCIVLELQTYLSDLLFFARVIGPRGAGWINSSYLEDVA